MQAFPQTCLHIQPTPFADSLIVTPQTRGFQCSISLADSVVMDSVLIGNATARRGERLSIVCAPAPATILAQAIVHGARSSGLSSQDGTPAVAVEVSQVMLNFDEKRPKVLRDIRVSVSCILTLRNTSDGAVARQLTVRAEEFRRVLSVRRHAESLTRQALTSCAREALAALGAIQTQSQ